LDRFLEKAEPIDRITPQQKRGNHGYYCHRPTDGQPGSETAANVAQRLGYTLVDQAKLQKAAEDYGMLKSELEEAHERRPTLVARHSPCGSMPIWT
jgi:hypothetical protein